jgi:type IV secretory pathway VirB2 component (pilin)
MMRKVARGGRPRVLRVILQNRRGIQPSTFFNKKSRDNGSDLLPRLAKHRAFTHFVTARLPYKVIRLASGLFSNAVAANRNDEIISTLRRLTRAACIIALVASGSLYAQQSPWATSAQRLATDFTGPIVRGLAAVAIVVGGLTLGFSEGSGRRTLGGLIFGLGMALGANVFMNWLFS